MEKNGCEQYRNSSEEENHRKCHYAHGRYRNLPKDEKQRLV